MDESTIQDVLRRAATDCSGAAAVLSAMGGTEDLGPDVTDMLSMLLGDDAMRLTALMEDAE